MVKSAYILLQTALLISILICSGCATHKTEIVYSSLAPFPEAAKSAVRIADNDPIQVTVGDTVGKKDLGGYLAVHPNDMQALANEIKRLRAKLKRSGDEL